MVIMNAIATILAMVVFFGIVWWAFSSRRKKANDEAAHLPFDLPDEGEPSQQNNSNKVKDDE
ncbi:MAG: cbb3-type cytochrome c oxidase subunit 3 [Orrella sp.]